MTALMEWLRSTPVAALMLDYRWSWPIAESLHFIGLTLMAGAVGTFDLRLLGLGRGIAPVTLHRLLGWGIAGFAICAVTGLMFISGTPDQYFYNRAFYFKSACLLLLGINATAFYVSGYGIARTLGPQDSAPARLRIMAMLSLILLAGVMLGGRMLTFFRPAAVY